MKNLEYQYILTHMNKFLKDEYYRYHTSNNYVVGEYKELKTIDELNKLSQLEHHSINYIDNDNILKEKSRLSKEWLKASTKVLDRIPQEIMDILDIMKEHSEQSYLVGGCIRDILLDIKPKDFDFCTDIPYDKLVEIFRENGFDTKETGKHFLVLNIIKDNNTYEIANFRKDINTEHSDGRHPDCVEIGTIYEDSQRRDFTINNMYFNDKGIIDLQPYPSSLGDISTKTLRFIGNPKDRLKEDYLRGIRFYRLLNKGLKPNPKCLKVVRNNFKEIIENTNHDRLRTEIEKLIKL